MRTKTLKYGDWEACISLDFAMNVFSLTYKGEDVLRTPESPEALEQNPYVYGTPLLFPPDRTVGDGFTFNGVEYKIPYVEKDGKKFNLHGRLADAPMNVIEECESRIQGEFYCDESRYPFPFRLEITDELSENGLHQTYRITNTGDGDMPFAFGLHTTFVLRSPVKISVDSIWEKGEGFTPVRLVPLSPEYEKYRTGIYPDGIRLHDILHDDGDHRAEVGDVVFTLSPNFREWVTWNMDGTKGFISLEPQSGPVNSMNMEGQYLVLKPGETETFETNISFQN